MTTYYVATLACYVLVDAENESHARELGYPLLANLYANELGRDVPINIRTIRPATDDEIELMRWQFAAGQPRRQVLDAARMQMLF